MSINAERAARRRAAEASPKFTASNGVSVWINEDGTLETSPAGAEQVQAVREFFVEENDDRLGRWRWPDWPEHVVYPQAGGRVLVLNESDADFQHFSREEAYEFPGLSYRSAARAFFDAHPEPKPWHEAKPGEVWVITTRNVSDEVAVRVALVNEVVIFEYVTSPTTHLSITDDRIESGRPIWPEVQS